MSRKPQTLLFSSQPVNAAASSVASTAAATQHSAVQLAPAAQLVPASPISVANTTNTTVPVVERLMVRGNQQQQQQQHHNNNNNNNNNNSNDEQEAELVQRSGEWEEFRDRVKRRLFYRHVPTGRITYEKPRVFKSELEVLVEEVRTPFVSDLEQAEIDAQLMKKAIDDQQQAGDDFFTRIDDTTKLPETNRGYQMLLKLGWKKDTGLGSNGNGILEPIKVDVHYNAVGLGKKVEDEKHNTVAAKERKRLEIERTDLTEEEIQRREATKQQIEVRVVSWVPTGLRRIAKRT